MATRNDAEPGPYLQAEREQQSVLRAVKAMTTKNDDQKCREDKCKTEGTAGSDDRVNWSLVGEEESVR